MAHLFKAELTLRKAPVFLQQAVVNHILYKRRKCPLIEKYDMNLPMNMCTVYVFNEHKRGYFDIELVSFMMYSNAGENIEC